VRVPVSVPACCRIDIALDLGDADGARIRLRHGDAGDGGVVLGYTGALGEVTLDRSAVGAEFPSNFRAGQSMPTFGGKRLSLTLWTDLTSVEAFADDGLASLTSLVGVPDGDGLTVEGIGGELAVSVTVSVPVS
jgi:sucrose-6-phosphate hydrolase SacC (GH32 family)